LLCGEAEKVLGVERIGSGSGGCERGVSPLGASAMNGEQQRRGSAGLTVNGRCGGDCRGLIAWVSGGLVFRERKTETSRKKEEKKVKMKSKQILS
jgi:hypothetical protein